MIITYENGDGLYVNLTNRCSNSCDFCVREHISNVYGDLWLDKEPSVSEIIDSIKSRDLSKYTELVFCGFGEPSYRIYDINEIVKKIRRFSDIPTRINTNGQSDLINSCDTAPLYSCFNTVSISLNYANSLSYDNICHSVFGSISYDAIIKFASTVKNYVDKVIMTVVDKTIPYEDIEICRKRAADIGVDFRVREYID